MTMHHHLNEIALQHLNEARHNEHGRSAEQLLHQKVLRQTLMALKEGAELAEHNAPYAGSLQVLHGRIRVRSVETVVLEAGHLHPVPQERHSVEALEDAVFLLTTVTGVESAAE
jgi:quercetin dioxygenase-like cupin family protein